MWSLTNLDGAVGIGHTDDIRFGGLVITMLALPVLVKCELALSPINWSYLSWWWVMLLAYCGDGINYYGVDEVLIVVLIVNQTES